MTWRDGVHLTGTPIWCDARRRRDICFVSSADRLGRGGHGQLIATPLTLALLGESGGGADLAVPVRKRFTLGTLRLELIPSGRGPGAAALLVDLGDRKILYAGAIRSATIGSCEPAEVRACDALVVHAPFGEEHHRFPRLDETIARTTDWARAELAAERRPVLFCDSALDGLEIATELASRGIRVSASRQIRELASRAKVTNITTPGKEPRAVVWLDTDHAGLAKALAGKRFATALASGRAIARSGSAGPRSAGVGGAQIDAGADGYDTAFVWASAGDRAQLLAWIASASAREVFVTGPCADAIAAAVGPKARVVGPPRQMALFAP